MTTTSQPVSTLDITDATGHTSYAWPTGVEDKTTRDVEREFNRIMSGKDMLAVRGFYEGEEHNPNDMGEVIHKFDPRATTITVTRKVFAGG